MQNNTFIIGIDVSKKRLDVACYGDAAKAATLPPVTNDAGGWRQLCKRLRRLAPAAVCMEPTSCYHLGVAAALLKAGFSVSLLHSKAAKDYASSLGLRNKSDRLDAGVLAQFGAHQRQLGKLRAYTPPTQERQALQDGIKMLTAVKREILAGQNRLHTLQDKTMRRFQQQALRELRTRQAKLEAFLQETAQASAECRDTLRLLQTIPGIGVLTAVILLAEGADKVADVRALAALHAIAPSQRQSGTSLNSSRLSPRGRRLLRRALYFPTLSAIRYNPLVRDFHARLSQRGMKGKPLVCACLHKLLRLAFGVMKNRQPFDPYILSTAS